MFSLGPFSFLISLGELLLLLVLAVAIVGVIGTGLYLLIRSIRRTD